MARENLNLNPLSYALYFFVGMYKKCKFENHGRVSSKSVFFRGILSQNERFGFGGWSVIHMQKVLNRKQCQSVNKSVISSQN